MSKKISVVALVLLYTVTGYGVSPRQKKRNEVRAIKTGTISIDKLQNKIATLESQLNNANRTMQQCQKKLAEKQHVSNSEVQALRGEITRSNQENIKLAQKVKDLQNQSKKHQKEKLALQQQISNLQQAARQSKQPEISPTKETRTVQPSQAPIKRTPIAMWLLSIEVPNNILQTTKTDLATAQKLIQEAQNAVSFDQVELVSQKIKAYHTKMGSQSSARNVEKYEYIKQAMDIAHEKSDNLTATSLDGAL